MCDEKEQNYAYGEKEWKEAETRIHDKAIQIFEEYLVQDCKWSLLNFHPNLHAVRKGRLSINSLHGGPLVHKTVSPIPTEILQEIRAGYRDGKLMFVLNNGLFSDVYLYTLERLRSYYNQFMADPDAFGFLKDEVEAQEVLYEILRRYRMIEL